MHFHCLLIDGKCLQSHTLQVIPFPTAQNNSISIKGKYDW